MTIRQTWVVLVVAAALLVTAALLLPVGDWIVRVASSARDAGPAGVALFFVAYVVAATAMVPGSLLTLAVGFAYGPLKGVLLASPASVTAATVAFMLGRTLLRERVARRVQRWPTAHAIEQAIGREEIKTVLLLRLSPLVPFDMLNYLLSLTPVRLSTFIWASAVGMLPGTVMYVYLGSLATTAAELSTAGNRTTGPKVALYALGLMATVAVVFVLTRTARRALAGVVPEMPRHG